MRPPCADEPHRRLGRCRGAALGRAAVRPAQRRGPAGCNVPPASRTGPWLRPIGLFSRRRLPRSSLASPASCAVLISTRTGGSRRSGGSAGFAASWLALTRRAICGLFRSGSGGRVSWSRPMRCRPRQSSRRRFCGPSSTHGMSVRGSSSLKPPRSCLRRPGSGACWHRCRAPCPARLVVVLRRSVSGNVELESLVPLPCAIGGAVCLADFDWLRTANGRLPDGVAWLRGKVTSGMDIMRLKEVLSGTAPIRAIADIGADTTALGIAISAGFCYAAGIGVNRPCSRTAALPNQPSGP